MLEINSLQLSKEQRSKKMAKGKPKYTSVKYKRMLTIQNMRFYKSTQCHRKKSCYMKMQFFPLFYAYM